ncbi:Aminoacylase-1 [Bienertia sinuspersici]
MKCVSMLYLEATRKLKESGLDPTRTIYLSFVLDKENGGLRGAERLDESNVFKKMNAVFVLDEGMPSPNEKHQIFLCREAKGAPGHGAMLYDNTAVENLIKSPESIRSFRASNLIW